ncbi:hypothetical protein PENTCL1PPCAC_23634, partial [Pristionchus entomophagus]
MCLDMAHIAMTHMEIAMEMTYKFFLKIIIVFLLLRKQKYNHIKKKKKIFVRDGCIVIEAKIIVKDGNEERFREKTPPPDFYAPSKFSDAILSVDGKKLHVSKQILAHASSYFEALFFGHFFSTLNRGKLFWERLPLR